MTFQNFGLSLKNVFREHVQGQQDKLIYLETVAISHLLRTFAIPKERRNDRCQLLHLFSAVFQRACFVSTRFELVGICICEGVWSWNWRCSATAEAELLATTKGRFTFHPKGFHSSKNTFGSPRYLTSVGNTLDVVLRVVPLHQHARCVVALVVWKGLMSFYPTKLLVGCVIKEESLQLSIDGFFRTSFKNICLLFAGCAHWSPNLCPSKAVLKWNMLMQIKYNNKIYILQYGGGRKTQ